MTVLLQIRMSSLRLAELGSITSPTSEVSELGVDSHAVHRSAISTENSVWPTLALASVILPK